MDIDNLRKHGHKPFNIAVVHGGPGAPGEMYPVAREISSETGVLEPLQTMHSVEGQVDELKNVLESYGNTPLVLIGFSWGAWLSYILTAYYPLLVKKLILISSGPFEAKYTDKIMQTRLSRFNAEEREETLSLLNALNSNNLTEDGFARFGKLMQQADSFDLFHCDSKVSEYSTNKANYDVDIFGYVSRQANYLRNSGELLHLGERIQCPVVAIHGDFDPHPAEGIKAPLSRVLKDFRFILLEKCGHYPWLERNVRDDFYRVLRKEIGLNTNSEIR